MSWDNLVIENSYGAVTEKNIDKFNVEFLAKLNGDHDSDLPDGEYVEFKVEIMGLELMGHYIASWIGDNDYPNETEPSEIELDYIDNVLVSQFGGIENGTDLDER